MVMTVICLVLLCSGIGATLYGIFLSTGSAGVAGNIWIIAGLGVVILAIIVFVYREWKRSRAAQEILANVETKIDDFDLKIDIMKASLESKMGELAEKNDTMRARQDKALDYIWAKADEINVKMDALSAHYNEQQVKNAVTDRQLTASFVHKSETVAQICAENKKNLSHFKNICQGKTVVLCGAGGTLNYYEPIEGAVHFGINRAFLYEKVQFDYLYIGDWRGVDYLTDELKQYKGNNCEKLFFNGSPADPTSIIPESYIIDCEGTRVYTNAVLYDTFEEVYTNSRFALDPATMPVGNFGNSALPSMQLILYMNPSKIYIAGVDYRGTHFNKGGWTEEYEHKMSAAGEAAWNRDGKMEGVLYSHWERLKEFASVYYPETEIVSLNPLGLKGLFTDEYTDGFLAARQEGREGGWISPAE